MKAVHIKLYKHQRGLGLFQWALVLGIAGFFLLFAFKVVPLYAENRYVESALRSLVSSGEELEQMSDQEIIKKLSSFYTINNVRSEGPNKNIKVERESEKVLVTVDYEARAPLFYNIDVILTFKNHLDSRHPSVCCRPAPETKTRQPVN